MSDTTTPEVSAAVSPTILSRVTQLPVVTSAFGLASHYYNLAKESHYVLGKTLDTAEATLYLAVEKAKPVVDRLENQLIIARNVTSLDYSGLKDQTSPNLRLKDNPDVFSKVAVVDTLACKALGKLEESCPVITRTPEEIVKDTREYCTNVVQPAIRRYESIKQAGTTTVSTVKDIGYQKAEDLLATKYGKDLLVKLSRALHTADEYLDYYLPLPQEEHNDVVNTEDPVTAIAAKLASKAKSRVVFKKDAIQQKLKNAHPRIFDILNAETFSKALEISKETMMELAAPILVKVKTLREQVETESLDTSEKSYQRRLVFNTKWAILNVGDKAWRTMVSREDVQPIESVQSTS